MSWGCENADEPGTTSRENSKEDLSGLALGVPVSLSGHGLAGDSRRGEATGRRLVSRFMSLGLVSEHC